MAGHWEHFSHGADIGVRGIGDTLAEAFEMAAVALTAVITDPARVQPREAVDIEVQAPDRDTLLVEWLDEIIYQMAVRHMLFGRYRVDIDDGHLRATALGEPVDRARHQPAVEVKGATFTELRVTRTGRGRWLAQCVVDV